MKLPDDMSTNDHTHTADCDAHGCAYKEPAAEPPAAPDAQTPRTDALIKAKGILICRETVRYLLEWSRQLERESYDLRRQLAAEREKHKSNVAFMSTKCSELEDQRDAALAQAAAVQEACADIALNCAREESEIPITGNPLYDVHYAYARGGNVMSRDIREAIRSLQLSDSARRLFEDAGAAADLAREEMATICERRSAFWGSVKDYRNEAAALDCSRAIRASITDPAAVRRTLEDAARYKARRHAIYLTRIRCQISLPKPSEDEFNAEYDAGCDKEREGYILDHRGVYVKAARKGEEG